MLIIACFMRKIGIPSLLLSFVIRGVAIICLFCWLGIFFRIQLTF